MSQDDKSDLSSLFNIDNKKELSIENVLLEDIQKCNLDNFIESIIKHDLSVDKLREIVSSYLYYLVIKYNDHNKVPTCAELLCRLESISMPSPTKAQKLYIIHFLKNINLDKEKSIDRLNFYC